MSKAKTKTSKVPECSTAPEGKHVVTVDWEYDSTGGSKSCEYCGQTPEQIREERAVARRASGKPPRKKPTPPLWKVELDGRQTLVRSFSKKKAIEGAVYGFFGRIAATKATKEDIAWQRGMGGGTGE